MNYPNACIAISLGHSYGGVSFDSGRLRLAQRRQILDVIVDI